MIRNRTPRVMSPAVPVPAKPQSHGVNSEQHFSPLPLARHCAHGEHVSCVPAHPVTHWK